MFKDKFSNYIKKKKSSNSDKNIINLSESRNKKKYTFKENRKNDAKKDIDGRKKTDSAGKDGKRSIKDRISDRYAEKKSKRAMIKKIEKRNNPDKWKMFKDIGEERAKGRAKKVLIIVFSVAVILVIFKFINFHNSQRKLIAKFENTNVKEKLITNNKPADLKKSYKIKDGIVYVPVLELCRNFNTKASYRLLPDNGIELKYKKAVYYLKRGSNEVRFKDNSNVLKMDGVVMFMDNTVYVPLDFIYKVLDVNVVQGNDGTVYMDNYPKKFNYDWVKENRYIAHALGGIGKYDYTNSREALEHSYKKGFRVFETDLQFTKDNQLVLLHSYGKEGLSSLGLPLKWEQEKPTEEEFLNRKILGAFHTMSFKQLMEYMKDKPDMYLVIDLKQNDLKDVEKSYKEIVKVAKSVDPKILDRLIPQIYYEAMYKTIMNIYDFKSMIYTTYRIDDFQISKVVNFSYEHGIKIVAVNKFKFSKDLSKDLLDRGISLYMFTYNDPQKVNAYRNKYVSGFYTDFLPKNNIVRDKNGKVIDPGDRNETENIKNIDNN